MKQISLATPWVGREEEKAVIPVIRSRWLSQGVQVQKFEETFARAVGARFAIAVSSCTTALHLALIAAGIKKGDQVVCPSLCFIATANVIRHAGAEPVFCDVDPETYNLSPDLTEKILRRNRKVKAVIVADQCGLPAEWNSFLRLGKKYRVKIIHDAACSAGSQYRLNGKWKKIGSFTDLACFSFHGRKIVTTGEGGMITTSNPKIAAQLKRLRHHGMSISDLERHQSKKIVFEKYSEIGFNYRMSDLQAAIGVTQTKKLTKILKRRIQIAAMYTKAFSGNRHLIPPFVPKNVKTNFQTYLLGIKKSAKVSRNQLMERLMKKGIATRRGIMAIHHETPYRKFRTKLPVTDWVSQNTIVLPLHPAMTSSDVRYVIQNVTNLVGAI